MGKERRRHERIEPTPSAPVEIQIMGADFLERVHAVDISVGGVAIRVPHGFRGYRLTDRVELVLKLPGQSAFLANGFIRHAFGAKETVFGVEFDALPDKAREKIEAYIHHRLRRSGPIRHG